MSADHGRSRSNRRACGKAGNGKHAAYKVEETGEEAVDKEIELEGSFVLCEAYRA